MKRYLTLLTLSVVAIAIGFTSCKKDGTVEPADVAVTGVSFNTTMLILEINESITVRATVAPEDATNKDIEWSIKDPAIATVENGVVKGVAAGETELTATTVDGGFKATIPVKVVTEKVPVEGISMAYPPGIKEGLEGEITIGFSPRNATNTNATIILSDPDILSIEYKGNNQNPMLPLSWPCYTIKGLKAGKCNIKAVSEDGGFEYECTVIVLPFIKVTEIEVVPENATIEVGETKQFAVAISPSDAENQEVEWSSSDTAVATVDANGLVTGVAKGEATITATAKDGSGVKGIATITVSVSPTSVTFDGKTSQEIYTWWGKEVDLKAEVTPEGVSLKHLTWQWIDANSSTNPDGLKYNVTDDKATLTYTWPSQTSKLAGVEVRAFYGNGNTVYAKANVYFQTFAWLLKYSGDTINYDGLRPLNDDFDLKYNWDSGTSNKLAFIAYYRSPTGSTNALPLYNKEYYIPTSEYTLTSSDPSKVKVTKSSDGESWEIERLNTADLVAITLTYKCGNHTDTYTLNLIP